MKTTTTYNPSDFIEQLEREANRTGIDRRVERRFVPGIGTVIVTFDIENDYDSGPDDLGHFDRKVSDYAIDAQEQVLLGKYQTARYTLSKQEAKGLNQAEFEARLWDKAIAD